MYWVLFINPLKNNTLPDRSSSNSLQFCPSTTLWLVQVLSERGTHFDCGACNRAKHINECNKTKKIVLQRYYEASKLNGVPKVETDAATVALLSLPSIDTVAYEAGCILCDCCSCNVRWDDRKIF